jgi:WD40 repeat protein
MKYLLRVCCVLLLGFSLVACGSGQVPASTPTPGPALVGTALPESLSAISPENANRVVPLARWGKGTINQIVQAPRGNLLAVASSLGIYLCEADTLKEIRFMDAGGAVSSVAFSQDGKTLASGSSDNRVRLWRVSNGALLHTLEGHTDKVLSVAFNSNGRTVASTSLDQTIRLWNVSDGQLSQTFKGLTYGVTSAAFSPDGKTLASGTDDDDNAARLWDAILAKGKPQNE